MPLENLNTKLNNVLNVSHHRKIYILVWSIYFLYFWHINHILSWNMNDRLNELLNTFW